MYIIAGLGNPEKKYDGTRHNAGFEAADELRDMFELKLCENRFTAVCSTFFTEGREGREKVLLMKPLTYMNRSGDSIKAAADYYKVPTQNIIILYDDISFPVGRLRVRGQGSAGADAPEGPADTAGRPPAELEHDRRRGSRQRPVHSPHGT